MNKTYIIVDIEATCDSDREKFPRHLMEPIEIGAVAVNEKFEYLDEYQTFIKPIKRPLLTDFCTNLTTITQNEVDNAPLFKEAIIDFEYWFLQFNNPEFCCWGAFDFHSLKNHCEEVEKSWHFDEYINIKNIFSKSINRKKGVGVQKALNIANMKFIGTHHRGIDDAKNTARLMEYAYDRI